MFGFWFFNIQIGGDKDVAALAEGQDGPSADAQQKTKIQTHACASVGAAFFWFRFLWPFKENELASPGETGLKIQFALAIQTINSTTAPETIADTVRSYEVGN